MKKGLAILVLCIVPVFVYATSQEVFLLPGKPGEPSKIVYPDKQGGVEYLIQYDGGESHYYLSGLLAGDTLGVFFIPPAACTLLEIHYCRYAPEAPSVTTYQAFAADVPDGVTLGDFEEYHSASSMPGPTPVGTHFADSTLTLDLVGEWEWDTLVVTSQPDVGTNPFYAGYTIEEDENHSTRIDANVSPPYHAIAWKQGGAAPEANGPGWYSSWHLFWVRALVKVYENLPPIPTVDRLSDSYLTTDRTVTAHVVDVLGIPADSHGVAFVNLHYTINSGTEDSVAMTLISGDSLDGVYSADLPGVSVYDTVSYYVTTADYNGAGSMTSTQSYVIREGTPGNILLLIEDDPYYIVHDAVNTVAGKVDTWDEGEYGQADSSVLYFYHPGKGPGQPIIFWFTWSGFHFADETDFLKSFLDGGGKLFVSSEDLPGGGFGLGYEDWSVPDGHFLKDYMKVTSGYDDYNTDTSFTQYGVPGDDITGAANLSEITVYPYDWAGPGNNWAGKFDVLDPACAPIFYDGVGAVMAYRYEDPTGYQIVWIYWPAHYIVLSDLSDYNTEAQDTLIARTLDWFGYVGIDEEKPLDAGFSCALYQCGPNPVTDRAEIRYTLSSPRDVSLKVYDITGRLVKTLVDKRVEAGEHFVEWNLRDDSSTEVAAGIYFYRLEAGSFSSTKKLIVVK